MKMNKLVNQKKKKLFSKAISNVMLGAIIFLILLGVVLFIYFGRFNPLDIAKGILGLEVGAGELNIETNPNLVTLVKIQPSSGIEVFAYDPNDYIGIDTEIDVDKLRDGLNLIFDQELARDALSHITIMKDSTWFKPTKEGDWHPAPEVNLVYQRDSLFLNGFEDGNYYLIRLEPELKSVDGKDLNLGAALIKFSVD